MADFCADDHPDQNPGSQRTLCGCIPEQTDNCQPACRRWKPKKIETKTLSDAQCSCQGYENESPKRELGFHVAPEPARNLQGLPSDRQYISLSRRCPGARLPMLDVRLNFFQKQPSEPLGNRTRRLMKAGVIDPAHRLHVASGGSDEDLLRGQDFGQR